MADPLSLVLGALPLAIQAVQASKALLGFMADIRGAPENIKAVSKEVHAFYNVLSSLSVVLKDQDVQTAISGNNTLLETVETLIKPINNCRAILGQLSVKLEKLRSSYPETHGIRSSLVGVKWSLFSKNEISKLQQTLEAEKLTISIALNFITMITSMRVLTITKENRAISEASTRRNLGASTRVLTTTDEECVILEAPTRRNLDSSTVMSSLAHVSRKTSLLQLSPPRTYNHSDLERTVDKLEATYMSMNQISESLEAIVHGTQCAVMSADRLLHRKIAHVYQDLSKAGIQIQQLKSSIGQFKELRKSVKAAASSSNVRTSKFQDLKSQWDGLHESNSAVVEVFFDCVSRFSSHGLGPSIDELQVNFLGSPEYRFESLPSFYPEQYVSEGSISKELFAIAMLQSTHSPQTIRYFLDYAETARRWQRIVVFAAFHGECQQVDALRVASFDDNMWGAPKALPSAVHSLLRTLLPFIEFYSSITRIYLDLKVSERGQIMAESERIEVVEDDSEVSKSDEMEFLQYMNSICCKQYVESDVVTYSRNNSNSYKVYVDSEAYIGYKVVFASGKKQGTNAFLDYLDEIKHYISLRHCANVSEFRGVVLDDTRRHLRSYLKELPMFESLERLLALANSRSKTIPLLIREFWARQLVQAVVEIHSQGLILGAFDPNSVAIRADGTAIFHRFRRSGKYIRDHIGLVPPEFRHLYRDSYSSSAIRDELNSQTDIFQLGLVLWQVTEHIPKNVGYSCVRYACTHWPRRTCIAPHANPVELPACNDDTPAYLCDIIRDCRLPHPQSRISASELAYILSATPQPDITPAEIQEALMPYLNLETELVSILYCDECGGTITEIHFYCNICFNNDYAICQACFDKGRHCLVPEHRLFKRAIGKNNYIDISRR